MYLTLMIKYRSDCLRVHGQFSRYTNFPLIFYWKLPCVKVFTSLLKFSLIRILLIIGGIEPNPGPQPNSSNTKRTISCVHNNVCSLLPKVDLIESELSDHDVICLTETHLNNSITDDRLAILGFQKPKRKDRNRFGGGVAIYIKNSLYAKRREDLECQGLELLWVEVHSLSGKFLIGVLYRPPSAKVELLDNLYDSLSKAIDSNLPVFLTGDFNINMLSDTSKTFKHFLQRLNLDNVIDEPTNFTTSTGTCTCIDLCITNNKTLLNNIEVSSPICSTHCVIQFELKKSLSLGLTRIRELYVIITWQTMKQ